MQSCNTSLIRAMFALIVADFGFILLAPGLLAQETQPASEASTLTNGLFEQGTALVYASKVATEDTQRGIALLQEAAAQGDKKALLELGGLYLYGTILPKDWAKARSYFDKAAEAGDWSGLAQYGAMLMWSERDWKEGQRLQEQAAEKGETSAWVSLAEGATYGYLGGGQSSRAKYKAYAEKARAAKEPKLAVLEAARLQWGISERASGPRAIAVLREAAGGGNALAAKTLIHLLRDGNGLNVARDHKAAREAMTTYASLLSPDETWQFERELEAAEAKGQRDFAALADKILTRPDMATGDFAKYLRHANENAAFYVVQAKLAQAGYKIGKPDGLVGQKTLIAMKAACLKVAAPSSCEDSVMRTDVVSAILAMG